jgi:hypothetical protein
VKISVIPIQVDGKTVMWDPATQPNPTAKANESRNGFKWSCYHHPLGKFFQNTIKTGITSVIRRIHDKEIPRYDKTAYTFDDPRLANLAAVLERARNIHIDDNDAERKRELAKSASDIVLFLMKEDIFYRLNLFKALQDIGEDYQNHPELYALTDQEQFIYDKFNGMGPLGTRDPSMVVYTFEDWKDPNKKEKLEELKRLRRAWTEEHNKNTAEGTPAKPWDVWIKERVPA